MSSTSGNDVSISFGGQTVSGWTAIRLTRSVERVPSDFEISATSLSPLQAIPKPGDPITVSIGNDRVLTGYCDRASPSITPSSHAVRIVGRSKCADLIDCNVTDQVAHQSPGGTLLSLATTLAAPFGITVINTSSATLPEFPFFQFMLTDSPWSVLERTSRYSGVMIFDDVDGNLVIADVESDRAASELVLGMNVQEATAEFSMDQRFSDYYAFLMGYYATDLVAPEVIAKGGLDVGHATDAGVPRHRPKAIVSSLPDTSGDGQPFAIKEAQWQAARRAGRSYRARVVTDSWRDGAGALWRPNSQIGLDLAALGISSQTDGLNWTLGTLTFSRTLDSGTTCEMEFMPKNGFLPEPIVLNPVAAPPLSPQERAALAAVGTGAASGAAAGTPAPAGNTQGFAGIAGQPGSPSGPPALRPGSGI